jgi:pimeloyl-ACP methyl ester carboxylesterase
MSISKTAAPMTSGSVPSADGTRIGYLRAGQDPAVVIVHGSNESARSHTQRALALADAFTVYRPDRRGRGLSGPHQAGHSLRTEVEDLQAVLAESGASKVFSVSIGGLIALETARAGTVIRQLALYEPAIRPGSGVARAHDAAGRAAVRRAAGPAPSRPAGWRSARRPGAPGHRGGRPAGRSVTRPRG